MQRSSLASPRMGMIQPINNTTPTPNRSPHGAHSPTPSPSKTSSSGYHLWGGNVTKGKHGSSSSHLHGDAAVAAGRTNTLVTLSLILNVIAVGLLLYKCTPNNLAPNTDSALQDHHTTAFLTNPLIPTPDTQTTAALIAAHQRELATVQSNLNSAQSDLIKAQASEKKVQEQYHELEASHQSLQEDYDHLKQTSAAAAAKSAASKSIVLTDSESACPCRHHERLHDDDLALQGSHFDLTTHEFEWKCDTRLAKPIGNITFCPEDAKNEQYFQLTFFDRPGAGSKMAARKGRPVSPSCVQLPPRDYQWPSKFAPIPVPKNQEGVHWPNLRVSTLTDLLTFNQRTPKNLYHFNASFYDYEQEDIVNHAAKYIPFDQKIRVHLDIGSGGGSLGLILKKRYDVQTISTVFADWPYCEYITERGNLCMYLDAMEAMPFAKFSYDLIHSSWVFHALFNEQLVQTFREQNRILRPGGYIWLNGGWSNSQVETMEHLFLRELGYSIIYQSKKPVLKPGKTKFDTVPFELEWEAIMVKPIRADESTCRRSQEMHANTQQAREYAKK